MTTRTTLLSAATLLASLTATTFPAAAETRISPTCLTANADAAMTSTIPADLPPFAVIAGLSGSSTIQLDLDAQGKVRKTAVIGTSGSPVLDDAARQAARVQTYAPETRNCVSVGGRYAVVVVFDRRDGN
jgi:TonB family protein